MSSNHEPHGSPLKAARMAKQLSQTDLSRLSRVHNTTISRLEAGKQSMSSAQAEKLAAALGVDPQSLLPAENPS